MKNWMHLPLAAVVAAAIGLFSARWGASERPARGAEPETAALEAELAELRGEHARLAARLATLPAPSAPAASPGTQRVPAVDLDQAIAAYMAKRMTSDLSSAPTGASAAPDHEVAALVERILFGGLDEDEVQDLWQKLRDEKRIDAVVAAIEREAELAPNNPDLQNELGKAYIQKVFDVGVGPMASVWGMKADGAFDRALELDETHWEARFRKALSLSNWPTFLGKQGESMRHFEILIEQQERGTPAPEHAMSYYFLGNLYDQSGDREKAMQLWKRGAERFPDDADLRQKTGGR